MSKLKKALEKAKAEHDKQEQKNDVFQKEYIEKVADVKDVQYVYTKVVEISHDLLKANKLVAVDESHPVTDQFKLLRTRIFQLTRDKGLNAIMVSGFDSDEGKSLVAANLAIAIAKDTRQTTLLVDVDFRRPTIHKLFGIDSSKKGLKQYFEDNVPLQDIFISPGINKLSLLIAGGNIPNAPDLIGSPKMEGLVREVKNRYPDRYIIFDTPGLNSCPDPLVFSQYIDAIILVARSNYTSIDSVKSVMEILPKEKLLGTVFNDVKFVKTNIYSQ